MGRASRPGRDYYEEYLALGPFLGVDPTTDAMFVAPQNLVAASNILPNRVYGSFRSAQGRLAALAAHLPSAPNGIGIFQRAEHADLYVFAVDNGGHGELWVGEVGGIPTALTLPFNLTAGKQTYFAAQDHWLFETNGTDTPLKIDESLVVTRWGIDAPVTPPTITTGGVGPLLGVYTYCVVFGSLATGQLSSQGALSAPFTATNNSTHLTAIPTSTDPQVTMRQVYRIGGSLGTWYLLTQINDNTTTTYDDVTADNALTPVPLTVFNDPPPAFNAIATHQQRIFGFGTPDDACALLWSNLNTPTGFNPADQRITLGENGFGDGAQNLVSTGGTLVLGKKRTMYGLWGATDQDWSNGAIKIGDVGLQAPNSLVSAYGIARWKSAQGSFQFDGSALTNTSDGAFQQSNVKALIDAIPYAEQALACSWFFDRMYCESYPSVNLTLVHDMRTNTWWPLSFGTTQCAFNVESATPVIAANLETIGQVDQWFVADQDLGVDILTMATSRTSDAPSIAATKTYRWLYVEAPSQPGATAFVTVIVNPGVDQYAEVYTVDLSRGPRHRISLTQQSVGNEIQVVVHTRSPRAVTITRVSLWGMVKRFHMPESPTDE